MVKNINEQSLIRERIENSQILKVLTQEQKEILIENVKVRKFKKGEVILSEGDNSPSMIAVVEGLAKIYKKGLERPSIARIVPVGGFIGHRAMFNNETNVNSAAALMPTTIYYIEKPIVLSLVKNNGEFAFEFLRRIAAELGTSDERFIVLTQRKVKERLAECLLHLKARYGTDVNCKQTLALQLSRADLAGLSNMTTANAIRTLSAFDKEGLIEVKGRRIRIIDEENLKALAYS